MVFDSARCLQCERPVVAKWMWCSAVIIIMGITMMIVRCIDGIDAKLIKEILNYKFNLMIRIILPQKE